MPTALAVPLHVLLCRQRLAATHLLISVVLMTLIVVQLSLGILHCQLLRLYLIVDAIVVILQLGSIRPAAEARVAEKRCDMEREREEDTESCCKVVIVSIHLDVANVLQLHVRLTHRGPIAPGQSQVDGLTVLRRQLPCVKQVP